MMQPEGDVLRAPPPPSDCSLKQAVCGKGLERERNRWVEWFQDGHVPSSVKLVELHRADEDGYSALHYAVLHYTPDLLYAALDVEGVNFNVRTEREGLTPLLLAAQSSVKNSVLWLLQDGGDAVDTSAVDTCGRNAVHLAALDPHCQYTIETLVRQLGEELCFQPDKDGNTPLHLAAGVGNIAAVEGGLLNTELWCEEEEEEEEGDDEAEEEETRDNMDTKRTKKKETEMERMVCVPNKRKQTALHLAVENGHIPVIRAIVSVCTRALVIGDDCGDLPLHVACMSGRVAVVKELLQHAQRENRTDEVKRHERYILESLETSNSRGVSVRHLLDELVKDHRDLAAVVDALTNSQDLPRQAGKNCCVIS